jgi:hypothetical protein
MESYTVTGPVITINSGFLELSDDQAEPRVHALEATREPSVYQVIQPTQFKHGEIFSYEGPPLNRALLINLDADGELPSASPNMPTDDDDAASISSNEGDPDFMTVKQLGELLSLSVKDTIALLVDYECLAAAYNSKVPVTLAEQIVDDYQSVDSNAGESSDEPDASPV